MNRHLTTPSNFEGGQPMPRPADSKPHPNSRPKGNHPWKRQNTADIEKRRIDSRAKGAQAEREFAALIQEHLGVTLRRNLEQSRSGGHDLEAIGDDTAAVALNRFAIEVKRYRAVTPAMLAKFWEQAEMQARGASRMPILAYRADRQEWRVLVPLASLNGAIFQPSWEGFGWTADVGAEAFCAMVREAANSSIAESEGRQLAEPANKLTESGHSDGGMVG
jgi:Holliday junction resolvase